MTASAAARTTGRAATWLSSEAGTSRSSSVRRMLSIGFGPLSPAAIGGDALLGHPDALRQLPGLPEHVDRDAAARIPIAADAQPLRLEQACDPLADADGAVLVECAPVAEARQIELQRL